MLNQSSGEGPKYWNQRGQAASSWSPRRNHSFIAEETAMNHSPVVGSSSDTAHIQEGFTHLDDKDGGLPSVLLSVFHKQNIDYQNDIYWMNRFRDERQYHPDVLDKSIQLYLSQHNGSPMQSYPVSPVPLSRGRSSGSVTQAQAVSLPPFLGNSLFR